MIPQLIAGGGVYVMNGFDGEEAIWAGRQPGVTTLKVVPAMLPALLSAHSDSEPLGYETIIYGAAPIPEPLLEQAMDRFGPILTQIYGQSEAPMTLTLMDKASHARPGGHRTSAGRAWRNVAVEVRSPDGQVLPVGEQGEVTISGPHHMTGYLHLEDATAEVLRDGWVWTRDIGTIDEQGFVYLLGRRDEMINSGGFNISPREVEHVLQDHPAVAECAVVGRPDPKWGAAVTAMVHLHDSAHATAAEILEFAKPRLTFRTPKSIVISSAIPRNPYGKVDRTEVLRILAASEPRMSTLAERLAERALEPVSEADADTLRTLTLTNVAAGAGDRGAMSQLLDRLGFDAQRAPDAAFLSGAKLHARTQDDFYPEGRVHVGSITLAAAVALADSVGDRTLPALAAGYRVMCAIADAHTTEAQARGMRPWVCSVRSAPPLRHPWRSAWTPRRPRTRSRSPPPRRPGTTRRGSRAPTSGSWRSAPRRAQAWRQPSSRGRASPLHPTRSRAGRAGPARCSAIAGPALSPPLSANGSSAPASWPSSHTR